MAGTRGSHLLTVCVGIPREIEDAFNPWYNIQHVPEQLAIPGFQSAARYVSLAGTPKYMALYERDNAQVRSTEAWAKAANTEWTRKMAHLKPLSILVSAFGSYVRAICLMASAHRSHGLSMTWRSVESDLAERRNWSNSLIWLIFAREKSFHAWFFQLKSRACRLQYSSSILYLSIAEFFGLSNRPSRPWNTGQKAYQRIGRTRDEWRSCSYRLPSESSGRKCWHRDGLRL